MSDEVEEMVYQMCVEWLDDWIAADPPSLRDEYDISIWAETEMRDAIDCFVTNAFRSSRARNDAVCILRALLYEYATTMCALAAARVDPNPAAVERILALPQTAQKSAEWHAESRELLTGHEFGAVCYGTPARIASIVAKKCIKESLEPVTEQVVACVDESGALPALKWGHRFEPVTRMLFEHCVAKGGVNDTLGRIRHPTLARLAASPDGLIVDGPRAGRLVEIKSPISRELNGMIPMEYYCQMQLQAEVCDVEAVEYVEARYDMYGAGGAEATLEACVRADRPAAVPYMGAICVVAPGTDAPASTYTYVYSPLFPTTPEGFAACAAWTPLSAAETDAVVIERTVWCVRDFFTKTVLRNRSWWTDVGRPAYEAFWVEVGAARAEGRYRPQALFVDETPYAQAEGGETAAAAAAAATSNGWAGV
jgi:hypothetical protein